MRKYGESYVMQISAVFGPFSMLTVKGCSETGLFRNLTNHAFRSF